MKIKVEIWNWVGRIADTVKGGTYIYNTIDAPTITADVINNAVPNYDKFTGAYKNAKYYMDKIKDAFKNATLAFDGSIKLNISPVNDTVYISIIDD